LRKEAPRVLSDIFKGHRIETTLKTILQTAVNNNHSVAFWRNPYTDEIHGLVSLSTAPDWRKPEIETLKSGFIFSPFENNDNESVLYMGADIRFKWSEGENWQVINSEETEHSERVENFLRLLTRSFMFSDAKNFVYYIDSDHNHPPVTNKNNYLEILRTSIKAIKSGRFDKVVPSRTKMMRFRNEINPLNIFLTISKAYPNSFISFVSTPSTGTWLGASPEILISVEDQEIFRTSSVAGTKSFKPRIRLSDVAWTQKEIEEQALVSRYIINCFKRIRLREFDEQGPKTVKAGNLLHLKTLFTVNMKKTNFPQLGSVMLKLLHPTSAICGMPKEEARSFLHKVENYNRKFYSGYLGPVNIENKTNIYVNIRCSNILKDKALFFAGAGVTGDSVPLREWKETEVKMQSIARFFRM
jgi:isochorismate synthase